VHELLSPAGFPQPPGCKNPRAHPATGGTRKLSVPGRVHSHSQELWFRRGCGQHAASNPFLTHGTVESPAKLLLSK